MSQSTKEALINPSCHFEHSGIARLYGQSRGVEKPALRSTDAVGQDSKSFIGSTERENPL
jgi:hypothetical protein